MSANSLVFVDSQLDNLATLLCHTPALARVVVLDKAHDAMEQILSTLAQSTSVGDLHWVCHGEPGRLHFGATVMDAAALEHRVEELTEIGRILSSAGGAIWLYGCHVAEGAKGRHFVQELAKITGATIHAATHPVGAIEVGASWDFDVLSTPHATTVARSRSNPVARAWSESGWAHALTTNAPPTFWSNTGKMLVSVGSSGDIGRSVIQQTDGKLVVAGYGINSTTGYFEFIIVRFNADGTLDTSFDTDGQLMLPIGSLHAKAYSVIQQADGKLLLAGGDDGDFALIRLNANGSLDGSFGTGGKLLVPVGAGIDTAFSVIQLPDGKLVVAGESEVGGNMEFSLIRLNLADGTLDTSFGTLGKQTVSVGTGADIGRQVIQQADGKLVVVGASASGYFKFGLARFDTNGALDASFGTGGTLQVTVGVGAATEDKAFSVVQQADGKLVMAGYSWDAGNYEYSVARVDANGVLDTSFGTGGKIILPVAAGTGTDIAQNMIQQSDGKLVIAGYSIGAGGAYDYSVVRLNSDGTLDTSFGIGGKRIIPVGSAAANSDYAYSVVQQADGKLVLAGSSPSDPSVQFSLLRLNDDGSTDVSFGRFNSVMNPNVANTLVDTAYFTEGGSATLLDAAAPSRFTFQVIDPQLTLLNSGNGDYASSSLSISRQGGANADDVFGFNTTGALFTVSGNNLQSGGLAFATFTSTGGTLAINFTSSATAATQALVNDVGRHIQYSNSNSGVGTGDITLNWTFNDGNTGSQGTGGALSISEVSTVRITAVNNAPTLAGLPVTPQVVAPGIASALENFTVADVDSASLTVTLTPSNGVLGNVTDANAGLAGTQITGSASTINAAIAAATFTATNAGAASVGVSVSDGVAAAVTGTYNLSALPAASTSARPVLDNTKSPALAGMGTNAAAPTNGSTAGATLVSALINTSPLANYSDANSDPAGIAITGINTTNGTLYFSTNGGTSWTAAGAVSATSARVLKADANTYVYYQPNAGYTGTTSDAITLKAWDNNGGYTNGQTGVNTVQWPVLKGTLDTTGTANDVTISGNYAYVADQASGLQIIDISNPAAPTLAGTVDTTGNAVGVAISGNHAYVADGNNGVQVINISNPASPSLTATFNVIGIAYGVAISGNYAYVAYGVHGLRVIDISNPASPTLAGTYDTTGTAVGVAISGNYAYVADANTGLQVINISNPTSPTLAGTYDTTGTANGVAISGNYAYVADGVDGLQVIDISNPANPSLTATLDTSGSARGITISGNVAYVADGFSGLHFVDISNPASPSLTATLDTTGGANGVTVSGNYAYVGDGTSGLQVINISASAFSTATDTASVTVTAVNTAPTLAGMPVTPQVVSPSVAAALENFTVADDSASLTVTLTATNGTIGNVTDANAGLAGTQITGSASTINAAIAAATFTATNSGAGSIGVSVSDGVAAAVTGTYNLNALPAASTSATPVLDNSKSPALTAIGANMPAPTNGSTTGATLVSALIGASGIANYSDANSDPAGIAITGINTTNGTLWFSTNGGSTWTAAGAVSATSARVLKADASTYVYYQPATGYNGTTSDAITAKAWDTTGGYSNGQAGVNTTEWPVLSGGYNTSGLASGVVIQGSYAYVADDSFGLQIIDISNPAAPTFTGTFNTAGNAQDLAVSGNRAYIAAGGIGLQIIDISTPSAPTLLSTFNTAGSAKKVAVFGSYAYVADDALGLQIVNVANSASPVSAGSYNTVGTANGVAISGNHAYVADGGAGGLQIINISNPGSPSLVGNLDTAGGALSVAVSGNYAYVADEANGLQIINISNPASPTAVGHYATAGTAWNVAVGGHFAYVSVGTSEGPAVHKMPNQLSVNRFVSWTALLSGIFFAHKVSKVLRVDRSSEDEGRVRVYVVVGQVFFASSEAFLAAFDFKEVVPKVRIDVSRAHFWDITAVSALDKAVLKFRREGTEVEVVGMNEASTTLMDRFAIHDKPDAIEQLMH